MLEGGLLNNMIINEKMSENMINNCFLNLKMQFS